MKQFNDYLELSRRRLPRFLFEYINGGTFDEVTLRANMSRLAAITLRQRVMRDMSRSRPTRPCWASLAPCRSCSARSGSPE